MDPKLSGGGELMDQRIHVIDLFRWVLGEFSEVQGVTASLVWKAPVEDNAFAIFRSPKDQIASLHASWTQWKNIFLFEFFGERGALVVEGLGKIYGTESLTVYRRSEKGGPPQEEHFEYSGPDHSWNFQWHEFRDAIRDNTPVSVGPADGLSAIILAEAVYEAARSASVVHLPQDGNKVHHAAI